ncbi:maleylpyruvate isomerase family mycothiol-dependent enzyme [Intrasporangium sp. DVR]|uniref:maleylpyruvate isomerase family mycothiol-dependent enzyme n=1 Tax=Intrasporangium sp. DVR TaxID=3127867 RepID=UPI00313A4DDE
MDTDDLWAAIDDQRRRTADLLDTLTPTQWEQESLCQGWTVRDVAAHLTLQQQHLTDALRFVVHHPSLLRSGSLNRAIHQSAKLQARLPTAEIIARIRASTGSRRHNSFVTERETLTDILVHGQDNAVPLGLELTMPTAASAEAATRVWETRGTWLARVFRTLPLEGCRLTATDMDWSVGRGLEVAGPVGALLLLLTGRTALADQLTGPVPVR